MFPAGCRRGNVFVNVQPGPSTLTWMHLHRMESVCERVHNAHVYRFLYHVPWIVVSPPFALRTNKAGQCTVTITNHMKSISITPHRFRHPGAVATDTTPGGRNSTRITAPFPAPWFRVLCDNGVDKNNFIIAIPPHTTNVAQPEMSTRVERTSVLFRCEEI